MTDRSLQLTKKDMAKVIVQALYNLPELPNDDHWEVKRIEKNKKENLIPFYEKAFNILTERRA